MKRLLLLPMLLLLGCATAGRQDRWLGRDKAQHFVVAGGIAAGTTALAMGGGASDGQAVAIAIPVTLSFGAGKELYDRNVKGTFWSWPDMFWNLLGALTGSLVVTAAN